MEVVPFFITIIKGILLIDTFGDNSGDLLKIKS